MGERIVEIDNTEDDFRIDYDFIKSEKATVETKLDFLFLQLDKSKYFIEKYRDPNIIEKARIPISAEQDREYFATLVEDIRRAICPRFTELKDKIHVIGLVGDIVLVALAGALGGLDKALAK